MDFAYPFSINLPITVSSIKLTCFITERIKAVGKACANAPHNHGDYELKYVASGRGTQVANGESTLLKTGDLFLLHPGEYHFQSADELSDDFVQYSIRFALKLPAENAGGTQKRSYDSMMKLLCKISHLRDEQSSLSPLFKRITTEITEKKFGYLDYMQNTATILIIEFLRIAGADVGHIFDFDELKHGGYWRGKLDHFMHARYMDDVKLKDLADSINVSERHASRLVIREYGISYIAKLTQIRVEQAKYRLAFSKKDLIDISQECGFSSYSYFATCFKKHVGIPPGEYREGCKNGSIVIAAEAHKM